MLVLRRLQQSLTATTEYAAGEASYTLNVYKSLSHSSITVEISAVTYNGQAQTPTVIVKDGDNVLPYGKDDGYDNLIYAYKVEFANNTNAALATAETNAPTATITALTDGSVSHMEVNWYRGSTTKTFTINKAQLTVTPDDKTYNVGDDITLTVSYDGFVNGETETVLTTQPTASYEQLMSPSQAAMRLLPVAVWLKTTISSMRRVR